MSDTILRQAVIDAEFRTALIENPAAFGVTPGDLPDAVERIDQETLDFWTEGVAATEIFACASTCSSGPFTILCDGSTK
ncbi:cinnamycin family lantibiotic [Saccharopolyspora sp. NFXS83]|uniref:cinnamycin family lantibiotic n=1 Tax=Saccharopolyspora sp. NFXS83 TaxID=2993560 RepID=UPI00224B47F1|nr:cinnamycin family lantibiotic [Saccharopolyspora sp. NFXS83]MCX2734268.1 cinnamycin family lantibiotic [Saccharopolyspora sp. NFXS83]